MPTYDFKCLKCNDWFEERHCSFEDVFRPCPVCGTNSKRAELYDSQYTRTESGGMQGRMGKAGTLSEDAERFARNSDTIRKETGHLSGMGLR
jgi:putative FmdB family regulatory protein